ncbi:MAG TPA: SgcJ/EcaC family oxidoreductase [Thermoanaerobaculia bacterium]|nr:SgcJ/EcaC family oxidoreductase [Thermoanaerobaculia bacterium]
MKRVLAALVGALLTSGIAFAADAPKSDEEMIRARVQEFADAWNKHDATAMAYFWSADGDLVSPFGRRASGLTEIQRFFADEHSKAMKNSTYEIKNIKVRFLNPQTAILDHDVDVNGVTAPDGSSASLSAHVTAVLTRSGGQWWIASSRAFSYLQLPAPAK